MSKDPAFSADVPPPPPPPTTSGGTDGERDPLAPDEFVVTDAVLSDATRAGPQAAATRPAVDARPAPNRPSPHAVHRSPFNPSSDAAAADPVAGGDGTRADLVGTDSAIAAALMSRTPAAPTPGGDADWKADLLRYPRRPFLKEQSVWALWVYRFGRRNDRRPRGVRKWVGDRLYWLLFRVTETLTGVSIPKSVVVGPGLRIWHFGNIFVHKDARLGANCTLRQGVTIGSRVDFGPVPVLEDDVDVGAYAQILGGIRVGKGAKIGAMSVVLHDVPPGATAVGIPARVVKR